LIIYFQERVVDCQDQSELGESSKANQFDQVNGSIKTDSEIGSGSFADVTPGLKNKGIGTEIKGLDIKGLDTNEGFNTDERRTSGVGLKEEDEFDWTVRNNLPFHVYIEILYSSDEHRNDQNNGGI